MILHRFAAARRRLEEKGMWQRLCDRQAWPEEGVSDIGLEYFHLGIPCPFLEDESCSIHVDRPLTCREYLVTSPAENCSRPAPGLIDWVLMPAKVWVAAARCEPGERAGNYVNWVPLIQALDWAANYPDSPAERNGPELLRHVLERLAGSGNSSPADSRDS
jgi:Fe-S-cluster containining protein